jgi:hypothetical protein
VAPGQLRGFWLQSDSSCEFKRRMVIPRGRI